MLVATMQVSGVMTTIAWSELHSTAKEKKRTGDFCVHFSEAFAVAIKLEEKDVQP